jgi:hypothetical protein
MYTSGCNHIYSCCSERHNAWDTADDEDRDDISVSQHGKESRIDFLRLRVQLENSQFFISVLEVCVSVSFALGAA